MRLIVSSLLLALAAMPTAAPAGAQEAAADESAAPIVVTGVRVQDFRDRLAACLARACPPDEDIDESLALGEALFVTGDLAEAKRVIAAAVGRNGRQAARYPEAVSDLYRADARVARHLGRDRNARSSTWEILRALQTGIPVEDHRHFTARFEIADMLLALGDVRAARTQLSDLQQIGRAHV